MRQPADGRVHRDPSEFVDNRPDRTPTMWALAAAALIGMTVAWLIVLAWIGVAVAHWINS